MANNNLKEIQKKIQEKDYENAYNLCNNLISNNENKSSSSSSSLNLFIMHGTCSLQLLKYNEAIKSFSIAITLDTTEQYTQKLWKVILFISFLYFNYYLIRIFVIFMKNLKIGKVIQKQH